MYKMGTLTVAMLFMIVQLYTFQVAIATDARGTTFAAFIYEDPCLVKQIPVGSFNIGFNKGDRRRLANISPETIRHVNLYRVDG